MPDLSHLWQRFLIAIALLFGLALGVGATVFGYSNTAPVEIGWSVLHLRGIPLWTVALVPLALVLVAGTLYHWLNSLHHFSEHMRHRRRVHELEAEIKSMRNHLDELLQMPDHSIAPAIAVEEEPVVASPALPEPVASNGDDKAARKSRKRVSLTPESEPEPVAVTTNGSTETESVPEMAPTAGS